MVAFHYPPSTGSSGLQRTLAFSRYLPDHDWLPIILTAAPRAHELLDHELLAHIPSQVVVERAFALDAAQHLAWHGRHLKASALPDRWQSWWIGAVPAGLRLIRRHRPALIWSTYPIPTAHLIALTLHRLTGLPWVADFRDPLSQDDYPPDPLTRRVHHALDRRTVQRCRTAVFTTPGTSRMYARRYPEIPASRWRVIANGYSGEIFDTVEQNRASAARSDGVTLLLHSGILYPSERDPNALFAALAELRNCGELSPNNFCLRLRGTGHDEAHRRLLEAHGIEALVSLEPHIPYHRALEEMYQADGLLILQGTSCNDQIPAKLYEYLRVRRPILALTDPFGDTAAALQAAGIDTLAPLDSKAAVVTGLRDFLLKVRRGTAPLAGDGEVRRHTREARTTELARLFDEVTAHRSTDAPSRGQSR